MRRCPSCRAELGPWEAHQCLSCGGLPAYSIRDRAIRVLERSDEPLAGWDVKRYIDRDSRLAVAQSTASQMLANDLRACWSGKGIYGMYRHGLLPGVRDLGRAAGIYVHVSEKPLTTDELYFVMRHIGYHFSVESLEPALWRIEELGLYQLQRTCAGWSFEGNRQKLDQQRAAARAMQFPKRTSTFHEVSERAAVQVKQALRLRAKRLK